MNEVKTYYYGDIHYMSEIALICTRVSELAHECHMASVNQHQAHPGIERAIKKLESAIALLRSTSIAHTERIKQYMPHEGYK